MSHKTDLNFVSLLTFDFSLRVLLVNREHHACMVHVHRKLWWLLSAFGFLLEAPPPPRDVFSVVVGGGACCVRAS